jgi:hypothetical protein
LPGLTIRPDAAGEERQRARLGRAERNGSAEALREPVAEIEVGDDAGTAPELLGREVVLERGEGPGRFVQFDQRRRPSVIR